MPVKALIRIIQNLDYPPLEMLRSTSQFFRDLPTDKHIHNSFLDLTMDYMDVGNTYVTIPCRNCVSLVGEDSHAPEETGLSLKKSKCGRRCYKIERPGVLQVGSEIAMDICFQCKDVEEFIDVHKTLCKKCWAGEDRTNHGKKEHKTTVQWSVWQMAPLGLAKWLWPQQH